MKKGYYAEMLLAEQVILLISEGKYLSQVKKGNNLLNLYSLNDFFVEVYYSVVADKIEKIEIMNDLSRIDQYIDEKLKKETVQLN
ncbi:hypothetical protein ACFLSE_07670 [Bacteroidota bacterium]